jgi:betaine-aldehyde dehydrogenase
MNSSKTAPKVEPARHWINGEWISSSTVAESISPSTGEVLGQYSAGGRVEAAAAITAARKAFDNGTWA